MSLIRNKFNLANYRWKVRNFVIEPDLRTPELRRLGARLERERNGLLEMGRRNVQLG